MAIFRTPRSLQTACESFEKTWRPLSGSILRGHPQRGISQINGNTIRFPSCKFGCRDCEHVGSSAETIGEEQDVGVTSRRDRQGAEVIDIDGNAGPFGRGHRDDGPSDRQPRGFPCLAFQAVAHELFGGKLLATLVEYFLAVPGACTCFDDEYLVQT